MKFLSLLFLLLFACSAPKTWDANEATNSIFAPDEQQFRRFEIGMSRTEFDAGFTGNAIYGNELEVIDSLTVSEGVYCETAFRFKEDHLAEISVQIVIDDEEKKNELMQSLKNKLEEDYGKALKDKDQYYWRAEGGIITTDIYLIDYSSGTLGNDPMRFVISLYYTAGTMVS